MRKFRKAALGIALSAALAATIFSGCGKKIDGTKEALVINGESINVGTANFLLRYNEAQTNMTISGYGMFDGSAFWDQPIRDEEAEAAEASASSASSADSSDASSASSADSSDASSASSADSSDASSASSADSSDASSASSADSTDASSSSSAEEESEPAETYGEEFCNQVRQSIEEMVLLRQHAADYNISIDDARKEKIDAAAAQMLSDNPELSKLVGCTEDDVKQAIELMSYESLMKDAMVVDVDREVSDEEAAQKTITYARFSLTNMNEDGTAGEDMTEEEKEAVRMQARELIKQLGESENALDADMDAMTKALNEDAYVSTYSYGKDGEEVLGEIRHKAAESLSDGEVFAEPIEDGNGLYVIRMDTTFDKEQTEVEKERIIEEREEALYDEIIKKWKDESTIEQKAWKKLSVSDATRFMAVDESQNGVVTADDAGTTVTTEDAGATDTAEPAESTGTEEEAASSVSAESAE